MTAFQAGFGVVEITPDHFGFPLQGYGNRQSNSTGVHDPLQAKALVVSQGEAAWALVSVDLCWVTAQTAAAIRHRVSGQTGLRPQSILIAATHTHSGPSDLDSGNWNRPFVELVSAAIVNAWEARRPARIATGAGFLYGHSLNRRWFERPIDPGVGVLRIDDMTGKPLGVVINFGLHPVVLGYDNYLASADFVGFAAAAVEKALGGTCLFTNGGCGDVNPLTETVRRQLAERRAFTTMVGEASYYGDGPAAIAIGDRGGGTFEEAENIGQALAQEVIYVANGLETVSPTGEPWHFQQQVNHLVQGEEFLELQGLGVGDFALVAQPGEVFVETALAVKTELRRRSFAYPWLVSYANDWQFYLVPAVAFPEGGYEVRCAQMMNHAPQLQDRFWAAMGEALDQVNVKRT